MKSPSPKITITLVEQELTIEIGDESDPIADMRALAAIADYLKLTVVQMVTQMQQEFSNAN